MSTYTLFAHYMDGSTKVDTTTAEVLGEYLGAEFADLYDAQLAAGHCMDDLENDPHYHDVWVEVEEVSR